MKIINLKNILKLSIPDNWQTEQDENITSLFDSNDGLGALQFSFYDVLTSVKIDPIEELKDYLSDKYDDFEIHFKDKFAYSKVVNKNLYWRFWLFKKDQTIVFVSYNCNKADIGKEDILVDTIMDSIK